MKKYTLDNIEEGIKGLKYVFKELLTLYIKKLIIIFFIIVRNGSLDLLMADSAILDYYRATDEGCSLRRIGETYVEDTYAIGMTKG